MVSNTDVEVKYSLKVNLTLSTVNMTNFFEKNIFVEKDQKDNGSHHEIQRDMVESCKETESKHR